MSSQLLQELTASLNDAQREAVEHESGPLLILAGAGSGKTRVLTLRIANLISRYGADPASILAVTFTNKAAGEMADRITRFVGGRPPGMWIGTFHSIGARILRMYPEKVGRKSSFTIYDSDDTVSVIRRVISSEGIRTADLEPKAVLAAISDARNMLVGPEEYANLAQDPFSRAVAKVYVALDAAVRRANAVTFDDLLTLPVQILREDPELLGIFQDRFRHVLVDEYQDTNHAQYRLVALLGAVHRNVSVVGDDDQSIYGWRGADIRNILNFTKDFPNAKVVRLEYNYRSTPSILSLANAVISLNSRRHGKTLRATIPVGESVTMVASLDERDEGEWIADEILARRRRDVGLELRDIAIVYRTNSQSRALEEAFRRRGIPYRLVGSVRFYERREIRDLMAYLRLIANPSDDESFMRAIAAPRRGVGATSIEQLAAVARAEGKTLLDAAAAPALVAAMRPAARSALAQFAQLIQKLRDAAANTEVPALIEHIIEATGYLDFLKAEESNAEDRLDNVRELVTSAEAFTELAEDENQEGTPLQRFLQQASLLSDIDSLDPASDAVTLMTVHNAKGLEFPVVFISGLEEGLFPLARANDEPDELEEERRLFYVGITRAERKLYLTYAKSRRRNGEKRACMASSFIRDLPRGLVEEIATLQLRSAARPIALPEASYSTSRRRMYGVPERRQHVPDEEASQAAPTFTRGARVRHARFGTGTIAELSGAGKDAKITIDFDDETIGRKRLVVAYAALESGWDE